MPTDTILSNATANFNRAAEMLSGEFDRDLLDKIAQPKEKIEITVGPQFDDGTIHTLKVFVVRHSDALGPAKGGIRMTPDVTLDDVAGLAMEMTWKCALMSLPFGGGKSGIVADPHDLDEYNKETLIRSYTRAAMRHIGPMIYVPAPDMGTNERDMGYVKDTIAYSAGQAGTQGCYVTGKPVILGGIPGRREATGRGVVETVAEACKALDLSLTGASAVVQGFGNVGGVAAAALRQRGAKVIAVSDLHGAIHNPAGLDVPALLEHHAKTSRLEGFPNGEAMDGKEMLELPCDILVAAAAASQITAENAPRVKAKLLAEGANSPTTPKADEILAENNVFVIPDILCNAGGVFVSYLEYTQETQQEQWTEEEVRARLAKRMCQKFAEVASTAEARKLSMREAAMYQAVKTVANALIARGKLP
ncbi:MAG: Glu/Leu/Phe/Val dehydrogenase [Phycisphaerae bacterium]|nr:Glu/Leu/Phe/Val dehydrogenase [Phycisphaerae bacterium]